MAERHVAHLPEKLLQRAPQTGMRNISSAIAQDFETLRQSLKFPFDDQKFHDTFFGIQQQQQQDSTTANVESSSSSSSHNSKRTKKTTKLSTTSTTTAKIINKINYESLHYAPQFDFITHPYSRSTTHALLFVASSYLNFPLTISREAVEFGIRLCSFIYFTQPPLLDFRNSEETQRAAEMVLAKANIIQQQEDQQGNQQNQNQEGVVEDSAAAATTTSSSRVKIFHLENRNISVDLSTPEQDVPQDRLARIPIDIQTALQIQELCNSSSGLLLSPGATKHFALLKEHNAFSLCPNIRYHDVATWAISLFQQEEEQQQQLGEREGEGQNRRNLLSNDSQELFIANLEIQMEQLLNQDQEHMNNNNDGAEKQQQQQVPISNFPVSIEHMMSEYESLRQELGDDFFSKDIKPQKVENVVTSNSDNNIVPNQNIKKHEDIAAMVLPPVPSVQNPSALDNDDDW